MSNPRPNLNNFLNWYTERNVKTRREMKTKALECWQPIVKEIVDYVKSTDDRFASLRTFPTGSYYERAKAKEPNEFDLMLVMEDLPVRYIGYRIRGTSFIFYINGLISYIGDMNTGNRATDYTPLGFVRVSINNEANRLKWKRDSCLTQEMLNASQVKAVLRRLVDLGFNPRFVAVKSHGPAITLYITNTNDGTKYSVDLTLAIKFIDWPDEAIEWITRRPGPSLGFSRGWPNSLLLQEIRDGGCHLVAKQPKGDSVPEDENGIFWRFSFSAADEKKLFLRGGDGEASSCRKQILRADVSKYRPEVYKSEKSKILKKIHKVALG
ncbi:cyclic GMP-AMP synthase-like receptor 1 [Porites lutea]|uniref:cyclic GMP-AMP synthase-like receptor 1 n=1 Tax=Porites lutea TaxID=51062 RepID=UPI003CC52968